MNRSAVVMHLVWPCSLNVKLRLLIFQLLVILVIFLISVSISFIIFTSIRLYHAFLWERTIFLGEIVGMIEIVLMVC